VASSACSSSSLAVAALLAAGGPATAQSSHLTRLESAVPAFTPDPVSAVAIGGWSSAWLAPAAGHDATGALLGLEHAGFASVTTAFAAARVRFGPVWQLSFAQTRVSDLFDDALLAEFPELATLRAAATQVGLDAVLPFGAAGAAGLGLIHEREEFLGDESRAWRLRFSGAGPRLLGVRSAATVERMVSGGGQETAAGRLRIGLSRRIGSGPIGAELSVGAAKGALWAVERDGWQVASSLRVVVADLVRVSGSLGAERDPYGAEGWLGFVAFAVGVSLGSVGADLRRGGRASAEAAPTAVSIVYHPSP